MAPPPPYCFVMASARELPTLPSTKLPPIFAEDVSKLQIKNGKKGKRKKKAATPTKEKSDVGKTAESDVITKQTRTTFVDDYTSSVTDSGLQVPKPKAKIRKKKRPVGAGINDDEILQKHLSPVKSEVAKPSQSVKSSTTRSPRKRSAKEYKNQVGLGKTAPHYCDYV